MVRPFRHRRQGRLGNRSTRVRKKSFEAPNVEVGRPGDSYEFGPFRLDPAERVLTKNGDPLPLTPKAFDILHLLVRNAGHLLEKNHLMDAIWPDAFVEEKTLAQNIFTLRRTLGLDRDGRQYIETVPKRGYRFRASVAVVASRGAGRRADEADDKARVFADEEIAPAAPAVSAEGAGGLSPEATRGVAPTRPPEHSPVTPDASRTHAGPRLRPRWRPSRSP